MRGFRGMCTIRTLDLGHINLRKSNGTFVRPRVKFDENSVVYFRFIKFANVSPLIRLLSSH